jgi:hypothetical protein
LFNSFNLIKKIVALVTVVTKPSKKFILENIVSGTIFDFLVISGPSNFYRWSFE